MVRVSKMPAINLSISLFEFPDSTLVFPMSDTQDAVRDAMLRLRPDIGVENQDAFITICRRRIYSRHIRDILHLKHDVKPIYFPPQLYYLMNFLTIPKGMCPAAFAFASASAFPFAFDIVTDSKYSTVALPLGQ